MENSSDLRNPFAGPRAATLAIAAAALCFGMVPLFARMLQAGGLDPAAIAFWRYGFTALVTLPFLPLARRKRRQAVLLGAAGLAMGLGWTGYLRAIEVAPVAAAGVVYMSYPVFALIFAWALLGQRPQAQAWGAAALVLAAAALIFGGEGPEGVWMALLLALPAPMFFGLIIVVLSAMVPALSTLEKLACGMAGAMLGLTPLAAMADPGALVPQGAPGWGAVIGLGLVTALVPQLIYTLACPHVGPARAATAGSFELPTMLAVGWLAFGEVVGPREALSAVLVIAAILLTPAVRAGRAAPEGRVLTPEPAG